MNNISNLLPQLKIVLSKIQQHLLLIAIIIFALLSGYILALTMQLSAAPPSEAAKTEEAKSVPRPRIEPSTVDTILSLEEQNVQVQSIFQEARDNPFTE